MGIQGQQIGMRSPISLLRVSGDAANLAKLANLTDEELAGLGVMVEDAKLMRAWLRKLARGQYKSLIEDLNQHLQQWTVKARMYVNPTTRRLVYRLEDQPASDRAIIAAVIARTFNSSEHERVRVCGLCNDLFVSPAGRGKRRDFCSTTHANTFKQRAYRDRQRKQQ